MVCLGSLQMTGPCNAVVTCLAAVLRVASSILAQSHSFAEMAHEIISTAILLPSSDSRRVFIYKQKYVHEVLFICLVKLVQEKNVVR